MDHSVPEFLILKWSNSTTLKFGLWIISQVPRNSIVYLVRIQFLMMSAARLSLCFPLAISVRDMFIFPANLHLGWLSTSYTSKRRYFLHLKLHLTPYYRLKEAVPRFVRVLGTGCPHTSDTLSRYTVHPVRGARTPCTSYMYMEYHIYEHGIPHIGTCHSKVSHEVQLQVQVINSQVIDFQLYCWKCRKIHSFGYVFITVPSFPFGHLCHDVFLLLFFQVNSIPI